MALVLPLGFNLMDIANAEERMVVDVLQHRLSDEWMVVPNFLFKTDQRDAETDIVLLHHRYGIGIIEVKGGEISLDHGVWVGTQKDPEAQLRKNAYGLQRILAAETRERYLHVFSAICLPNVTAIKDRRPSGLNESQLILAAQLDDTLETILTMFSTPYCSAPLAPDTLQAILDYLLPTAEFVYQADGVGRYIRRELDVICDTQVDALSCLDAHTRVFISGRAGTGKTYLATTWARTGLYAEEGESPKRVLLTCYNDPLAQRLKTQLGTMISNGEDDEPVLVVGAFLRTVTTLEGMPPITIREGDTAFWTEELPAHILRHWDKITQRFDRIIVDEAQDFSPAWIGLLESLLDPDGDGKFFLLGDMHQEVMARGFSVPSIAAGWVHGELRHNVRNSRDIARLARRFLDGSVASPGLPTSEELLGVVAEKATEVVAGVADCLARLRDVDVHPRDVLVVAGDGTTRDLLRDELRLGIVDDPDRTTPACETALRAKGLEYAAVIVAVGSKGMRENDLYVAVTRAVNRLYVVAPNELLARLQLV